MKHVLALVLLVGLVSSCGLFGEKKQSSSGETAPRLIEGPASIVIVVPHEELTKVLPQQLQGWKVELPPGVVIDNGAETLSRARANYWQEVNGEVASFNLEVVDGTHVPSVQVALAITVQSGGKQRSGVTVGGYPVHQQWTIEAHSVTAVAVIAKRFVVTLKGTNLNAVIVKRAFDAIDVKRLEELAGVESAGLGDTGEPNAGVVPVATTSATVTGATAASTTAAP